MYNYVCATGGLRLGIIQANSDADFQAKLSAGDFEFYLPIFFNVYTNNPFTSYGNIKNIPPAPLRVLANPN